MSPTPAAAPVALASLQNSEEVAARFGSQDGKVFLITGCSSGIGKECARSLAASGATVVMACRAGDKAEAAAAEVRASAPRGASAVHLLELDLGAPASVEACSKAFLDLKLPLHGLINNAGLNGIPKWGQFTPGVETQFATNFLGHFQLTQLLDEKLRSTDGARVVNTTSESHRRVRDCLGCKFSLTNELPPQEARYEQFHAYAFSNFCRILWTRELAKKVSYPVVCLHPGIVDGTGMLQHMSLWAKMKQVYLFLAWELRPWNRLRPVEWAARTQTWAAVAPVDDIRAVTGLYFSGNTDCTLGVPVEPTDLAKRDDLAASVYAFADQYFKDKSVKK